MLLIAMALASATVTPLPTRPAQIRPIAAQTTCLPRLDPRFVRFVQAAPSSGRNPLFRLISAPGDTLLDDIRSKSIGVCIEPLVKTALDR